jgi:hypothetical protein
MRWCGYASQEIFDKNVDAQRDDSGEVCGKHGTHQRTGVRAVRHVVWHVCRGMKQCSRVSCSSWWLGLSRIRDWRQVMDKIRACHPGKVFWKLQNVKGTCQNVQCTWESAGDRFQKEVEYCRCGTCRKLSEKNETTMNFDSRWHTGYGEISSSWKHFQADHWSVCDGVE